MNSLNEKDAWFEETLHPGFTQRFLRGETLYTGKSEFQEIDIFTTEMFGKIMLLDGAVQITEKDSFFYHEVFAHIPLNSLPDPKKVLIIGGGDGCLLKEALKHSQVQTTMVEIDGMVVDAAKQYLPELSAGAFDDERANVIIGDGLAFVDETDERYDVILIDSTDPDDISDNLFTAEFLAKAKDLLVGGGILVMQAGTPFFQEDVFKNVKLSFSSVFENSGFYYATTPTYSGGQHAFAWGSRDDISLVSEDIVTHKVQNNPALQKCLHYNAHVHAAAFAESSYLTRL